MTIRKEKIAGAIRGLERIKADFQMAGIYATTIERVVQTLRDIPLDQPDAARAGVR